MSKEEIIDVINEQNIVIGQMTKRDSYKQRVSHRIVHVIVFDGEKLYIPKRSLKVGYLPGYFCTSAGGHVQAGESSEVAALRELEEEIGLGGPVHHVEDFFFNHEFKVHVSLYIKQFNHETDFIILDPSEVDSGYFYTLQQIYELDKSQFHPQLFHCLKKVEKLF